MTFITWSRERRKLILRNYFSLTVFLKRFIVDVWHRRCLNKPWVLNMPEFSIYRGSEYTRVLNMFLVLNMPGIYHGSGYITALNMSGLHRVSNTPDYAWMCLNLSEWLLFTHCNSLLEEIIDLFLEKWKFDFFSIVAGGIWLFVVLD